MKDTESTLDNEKSKKAELETNLQSKINKLNEDLSKSQDDFKKQKVELDQAKKLSNDVVKSKSEKATELEKQINQLNVEKSNLTAKIVTLETAKDDLSNKVKNFEKEKANLSSKISNLEAENKEAKSRKNSTSSTTGKKNIL